MTKRLGLDLRSLPAQMILSYLVLVLLMASAAGLPVIWLVRDQLTRQVWAQVDQGGRAAEALYTARQNEVGGLAVLTAQRPTLRALMAAGEPSESAELPPYLHTLQQGAGLDLVLLCDPDHRMIAQAGGGGAERLCADDLATGYYVLPAGEREHIWFLAGHPLEGESGAQPATVIVGMLLDDDFALQMEAQTGLEHTLLVDGWPIATSLPGRQLASAAAESRGEFVAEGEAYYYARAPLAGIRSGGQLGVEVALPAADIRATERRLVGSLGGGILAVAAATSLLGVLLARRISRPLAGLADAASALSRDELSTPLEIDTNVREVALVAQALEGARADLEHMLTQLRREKAWTDHLLAAIVEGIVTLDRRGRITFFSRGAERIMGHKREEVLGRLCDEVFLPVESDSLFSHLIPPPGQQSKIVVQLRDGRHTVLSMTGARLLPPDVGDGPDYQVPDRPRVALVFRDVSEEEAVHRLLAHFMANVTHEFRTPLSALAASVELLLDQVNSLDPAELQELLTALHLSVLGLQTLVDNLLEGASIEAGRFRISSRPSSLSGIIAEAIRMMQPLLDKRSQQLVVELPASIPVVEADPRRVVQVIINLLSNASKYCPDDSEIAIAVTAEDGRVRVSVADQGTGIPTEQRADIFRRFTRSDEVSEVAQYGIGLGLSIVKAVVQAHGGQVGVEDRPGGGAVFWFTLQIADSGENEE
jgi:PAS domain S-box-containing protein